MDLETAEVSWHSDAAGCRRCRGDRPPPIAATIPGQPGNAAPGRSAMSAASTPARAPAAGSGFSTPSRIKANSATTHMVRRWPDHRLWPAAGVWGEMCADVRNWALVFMSASNCRPGDYIGVKRKGPGLFGESLVALDLKTGKRKMALPDGPSRPAGDNDVPCSAMSVRHPGERQDRRRPIAQPTKQSLPLCLQPRDWRADLANPGSAALGGRRARRMVFADPANPLKAAGL